METKSRILITGGTGLLGSALTRKLRSAGFEACTSLSSRDLDLLSYDVTLHAFCDQYRPEYVFHLAGAVYGLGGNLRDPGRIFLENTLMNTHVAEASRRAGVKKIVAMGSICAYPSPPAEPGPLREELLFFGEPHPGERAYGQAKRAMLSQLEAYQGSGMDYAFAISTNLYGPNDRFNLENGHVVPSLIRKFYEAAQSGSHVDVWGDGLSRRDIMHSWDAAQALIIIMQGVSGRVNLATGRMLAIREIAETLGDVSGVKRNIRFDLSKPRGHEFPNISVDRLRAAGFQPSFTAEEGLAHAYRWYAENVAQARH
ncbi:MAG: NAD-dependent epimerase/dehydratase family protein [Hyphomicrobiaceae bacterium]|nr:MAG: NAD-dependent epimerase/dehydratase family protein [Hyphomicrobiaceae bacterium]